MKVKIFGERLSDFLEQEINEFIADKNVIDIKYQSLINDKFIYDRVLIVYEE